MSVDHIRYDILTQDALRGVVRTVLSDAATNGLPGDHHFFISFDTQAEGVTISSRLKAQWPAKMTIVLQHQFWDLTVGEESFEVGLSFNGIPERLIVPFAAITAFEDPSVGFQMAFAVAANDELLDDESISETGAATPSSAASPHALSASDGRDATVDDDKSAPPAKDGEEGAAVVRLDQFRKKK
jgi:uncharacterized protein